jgi:CBS domain containing-hemolysin-like protein
MEIKEENGQFVFEPHQFLTPTQIRSFFSRLTAARREQTNRNQSQTILVNQDDDEDVIAEQENEFESSVSAFNEDSVRSQALQVFQAIQPF